MSFQYDQYLANHRANVKRGFDWLCENLPDVTNDISDAAWQIEFAHDKSKDKEDEYNAYDAYFYGNNRSYKVVQDYQRAWLTHIHRTTKINILAYASEPDKNYEYDGDIVDYKGKRYFVSLAEERVKFIGIIKEDK